MSHLLNSISQAMLQPTKQDSIVDLLRNSEIEFSTCSRFEDALPSVNTGFGKNNDLYYETPCKKHKLNTPLYKENYFSEFKTEEEKKQARHALGLYDRNDVVLMSLITTNDTLPSQQDLTKASIKQLRAGDQFFTPVTSFKAVYDSSGITLSTRFQEIQSTIVKQQNDLLKIMQPSNSDKITSLGDVTAFLQGFNNGDNLQKTLDDMNQEMVRFEVTGQITK